MQSEYFRTRKGRIGNERLQRWLEETEIKLIFYPHYEMQSWLTHFSMGNGNVILGKGAEMVFDFEKGTPSADTGNWTVRTHESNNNNNEQGSVRIVNRETSLVHDGDQTLVSDIAFLHSSSSC